MRVVVVDAVASSGRSLLEALAQHRYIDHVISVGNPSRSTVKADLDVEVANSNGTTEWAGIFRNADAVVYAGPAFNWFNRRASVDLLARLEAVCRGVATAGIHNFVCGLSVGAYAPAPMGESVREDWPTSGMPGSRLSHQLSQAERIIQRFHEEHSVIRTVSLRMAPVVGPVDSAPPSIFERWGAPVVGRYLLGHLLDRSHRPVIPDVGPRMFQVVHVADMADAFCRSVTESVIGPYNIAGQPFTSRHLAESVSARTLPMAPQGLLRVFRLARGLGFHSMEPESCDLALRCPVVETSHAREELGWTPRHDMATVLESFADVLSSERNQPSCRRTGRVSGARSTQWS
jgi:nucleoside-diphosphate-sugar epimerase